jgi:hypothetical protein
MKRRFQKLTVTVALVTALLSCSKNNDFNGNNPEPPINKVVFSAAGDSAAIVAKLNEFRLFAGDPLNTAPGANYRSKGSKLGWQCPPILQTTIIFRSISSDHLTQTWVMVENGA